MASRVGGKIVVLDVGSETIHLDVAVHCEIEISAVVDQRICVLNKQLKIPRLGGLRRRAKAGGGEISSDVHGNISAGANVALVCDLQTRKLSGRTVRVIAGNVECQISSAGDCGAGQHQCV